MVFKRTVILFLLQRLVMISGQAVSGYHHHHHPRHSLDTDRTALLAFKRMISSDPYSTLANWNETSDVCNFTGVTCNKQRNRMTELTLQGTELVGLLSPFISNLTRLQVLDLVDNHLFGIIPPEFSSLRHIRHIQLDRNNLHGPIPDSFSLLSNLTLVTLMGNTLTGMIPASFFSNCTLLRNVDLSDNSLTGKIPAEIGNCPNLWTLNLYNNQFTGVIPASITNASLINLDLEYNLLSGELPSDIVAKLSNIHYLHLSYNNMTSHDGNTNLDPFFTALANCTSLEELELAGMGLGGRLPSSIGRLGVNLTTLYLQENRISGSIHPNLANLTNLTLLNLTSNLLTGMISAEISHLLLLEQLSLSHNFFSGKIPAALGQFPHLGLLDLSNNRLSGEIPKSLGDLVRVNFLFLNNNLLSGAIPPSLGQCTDLSKLDLSYNRLTGSIPPEISSMREIRIFLNLSHNSLDGPLPIELSKLENVQEMDLSSNNLTGNIFLQISSCIALRMINLSRNSLQGPLPETLGDFKNLEVFDVSRNHLSGPIPVSLNIVHTLTFLDLSFNNFVGIIPSGGIFNSVTSSSFLGNNHLSLVSDFGIARLVMTAEAGNAGDVENIENTTTNVLSGSIGYIAPEYAYGSNTSTKGDVFSFGILVLEIVTRKRPTDDMFVGELSLQKWVKNHYRGRIDKVVDSTLVRTLKDQSPEVKKMWEVAIGELIEMGILCTQETPSTRPSMLDAADDLDRLKRYITGDTTATFSSSLGMSSSRLGDD
ncbi:hypothetical protein F0562_024522 [Nyssa sinensis]|uniref:Protein kinase domain-containing protein n=1 Tax=Nyssa sinensis TaxID=561372 RepID=A0A5J5BCW5_9ASTE|nr:hypothetical protein F0562_024522 [Nyssa sinensis]